MMKRLRTTTWTLKKKTGLAFLGIVICVLVIYIAQTMYVSVLHQHYQKIEELDRCYNGILIEAESFHNALTDYSYGNGDKESIIAGARRLRENALKFRNTLNEDSYDRKSLDLANLAESYIDSGLRRAEFFDNRQYADCIVEAENFAKINGYLIRKFAEADSSLRIYTEQIYASNEMYLTQFRVVLMLMMGLIGLVFFILIAILWKSVLNPITKLSYAAGQYRLGNEFLQLCDDIDFNKQDEPGKLASSILDMTRDLERTVQLEKEMQLKLMQSRINPHFLFNSFNMIADTAFMEEAGQTYELLEALGAFLRYNLDNLDKTVKIKQEIENLESYLIIQRKRFGERINFSLEYDQSVGEVRIPCLILQPMVENAVIHGVGRMKSGGEVRVCLLAQMETVEISITDNGQGMDEVELARVRALIETAADREAPASIEEQGGRDCIGVRNVFGRLRLFYQDKIQVSVKSESSIGTRFWIAIPQERDGERNV